MTTKRPEPKKRATKAPKRPTKPVSKRARGEWSVDASGRWRDHQGRFVARTVLLDRLSLSGDPDDVADMLEDAARSVGGSRSQDRPASRDGYYVVARLESRMREAEAAGVRDPKNEVGWVSCSHAFGLKAALYQAATFLRGGEGSPKGKGRLLYAANDTIVDLRIRRVHPGRQSQRYQDRKRTEAAKASKTKKTKTKTKKGKKR